MKNLFIFLFICLFTQTILNAQSYKEPQTLRDKKVFLITDFGITFPVNSNKLSTYNKRGEVYNSDDRIRITVENNLLLYNDSKKTLSLEFFNSQGMPKLSNTYAGFGAGIGAPSGFIIGFIVGYAGGDRVFIFDKMSAGSWGAIYGFIGILPGVILGALIGAQFEDSNSGDKKGKEIKFIPRPIYSMNSEEIQFGMGVSIQF